MNAHIITHRLINYLRTHAYEIVIPNFYVGAYEMDVFKLSQTGYVSEYEVKISRGDFKADFNKKNKHTIIQAGKRTNRFFFVCPEDLIHPDEIPSYAGLIYFTPERGSAFTIIKPGKLISKEKRCITDSDLYKQIALKLSFRDTNTRTRLFHFERRCADLQKCMNHDLLPKTESDLKEKVILFAQYVKSIRQAYKDEIDSDFSEYLFYSTEFDKWWKFHNENPVDL